MNMETHRKIFIEKLVYIKLYYILNDEDLGFENE